MSSSTTPLEYKLEEDVVLLLKMPSGLVTEKHNESLSLENWSKTWYYLILVEGVFTLLQGNSLVPRVVRI